jgi:23S rRNA G2445 N2-methylase RlmL
MQINLRALPLSAAVPSADTGGLVANPPYGERLARGSDLGQQLGTLLGRFEHYQRGLIVPRSFELPLRADRFLLVFNGAIECELRRYDRAAP